VKLRRSMERPNNPVWSPEQIRKAFAAARLVAENTQKLWEAYPSALAEANGLYEKNGWSTDSEAFARYVAGKTFEVAGLEDDNAAEVLEYGYVWPILLLSTLRTYSETFCPNGCGLMVKGDKVAPASEWQSGPFGIPETIKIYCLTCGKVLYSHTFGPVPAERLPPEGAPGASGVPYFTEVPAIAAPPSVSPGDVFPEEGMTVFIRTAEESEFLNVIGNGSPELPEVAVEFKRGTVFRLMAVYYHTGGFAFTEPSPNPETRKLWILKEDNRHVHITQYPFLPDGKPLPSFLKPFTDSEKRRLSPEEIREWRESLESLYRSDNPAFRSERERARTFLHPSDYLEVELPFLLERGPL
jgi:hypothetical protein